MSDSRKTVLATGKYLAGILLALVVMAAGAAAALVIPVGFGLLLNSALLGMILAIAEMILIVAYAMARDDLKNGKL